MLKPLMQMWERVELGRTDSDRSLFTDLMYLGEMVAKLTISTIVAAIGDDKDRSRYRQIHSLVRASGIGEWADVLDDTLTGPTSQFLSSDATDEKRTLMQRSSADSWQHQAVTSLNRCLMLVDQNVCELPAKVDARRWFRDFARLRNKTRGHGAPTAQVISEICPHLEQSLKLMCNNSPVFLRQWVYLHRNLSGKYRVLDLGNGASSFDFLKSNSGHSLVEGVYIWLGRPAAVELVSSTVDISDFFFVNGGYTDKHYERLSYVTGIVVREDAKRYNDPVGPLPGSETEGLPALDIQGDCFGNLPSVPRDYIARPAFEEELRRVLLAENHPIVTLQGPGGIGKTSLALSVLHDVVSTQRYEYAIWLSARDIDLLPEGPKLVRPAVVDIGDIARQFVTLCAPRDWKSNHRDEAAYFGERLGLKDARGLLVVLDNFETLANPIEVFRWLDTCIRVPNKVLITTRQREFKGDYPINISGMTDEESQKLIAATSKRLGIEALLTGEYCADLSRESDGHPYVIKILLGEIAKKRTLSAVGRIMATADDILIALFERTYADLSPAARRVFLTLCNWRSTVPLVGLQAVLARPANEKMNADEAIDELVRSSFIELIESEKDGQYFVGVPLAAAVFGRKKYAVSPMKAAIQLDTELIREFGAGQRCDVRHGVEPRIERWIRSIARDVEAGRASLESCVPMLEFVARSHPKAWLLVSDLYEDAARADEEKESIRRYLEFDQTSLAAWRRLARLCRRTGDASGELHALVEISCLPGIDYLTISNSASDVNYVLSQQRGIINATEKELLVDKVISVMESRIGEASATDLSRLAWLCRNTERYEKSQRYYLRGLELDPDNEHCLRLAARMA